MSFICPDWELGAPRSVADNSSTGFLDHHDEEVFRPSGECREVVAPVWEPESSERTMEQGSAAGLGLTQPPRLNAGQFDNRE